MGVAEVFGWVIYGILALFCISGLIDIFTRGRNPRGNIGSSVLFIWMTGIVCLIVFVITDINKLHLLWVMAVSAFIGMTIIGRVVGMLIGLLFRVNVSDSLIIAELFKKRDNSDE